MRAGTKKHLYDRGAFLFNRRKFLKVARTRCDAAVLLCALCGTNDSFLDKLGTSFGEIAGTHHAVLLEEFFDRGCDNVTHKDKGEMIKQADSRVSSPLRKCISSTFCQFYGLKCIATGVWICSEGVISSISILFVY